MKILNFKDSLAAAVLVSVACSECEKNHTCKVQLVLVLLLVWLKKWQKIFESITKPDKVSMGAILLKVSTLS